MNKKFYLTTTLPYVNAPLHLGHAVEIIRADAVARFKKLEGYDVFFNTGTDEHGAKIFESAEKAGKNPKEYVDHFAHLYKETLKNFGVLKEGEGIHFVRTTDEHHVLAAEEFWKRCDKNGFIYKKDYAIKYCVGCEEEKTESELVDGKCPIHNREVELIQEENYFFKFSEFQYKLLEFYEKNPDFIIPDYRMNEMREFIKRGLQDFSISRLKEKMPWGISVPGDETHVMYVWFDALVNYISTLGWPENENQFKDFWEEGTPTQYCGKDNTRFQGVVWQAMLMAAGLKPTKKIVVDGFILGEGGVKMSKTLGNVIDPLQIVEEFGTDALRYFVLREFHPFEDTAVSKNKLLESYNANLANGIGNLTSRIMKMAEDVLTEPVKVDNQGYRFESYLKELVDKFRLDSALDYIWLKIAELDREIQEKKPWQSKDVELIKNLVLKLYIIGSSLEPFLPETAKKIIEATQVNKKPEEPLFIRK